MADQAVVGSVAVEVVPDASQWATRLRAKILPEAAKIGQEFGKTLGDAAAKQIESGVAAGLRTGSTTARTQGAKAGDEYGGKFADSLRARLDAALKTLPDIKLDADSTAADQAIAGIRANLEAIRDRKIGVDIDVATAVERLDSMRARLEQVGAESPNVQVQVDTAAAAAQLAAFQAEVDKVAHDSPTVTVDANTGAAETKLAGIGLAASGSIPQVGLLATTVVALGSALIPIGAVGAGALAAIGAGAVAATAGVGVLVLALAPVIAAVTALGAAHAKAGTSATSSANAQLQAANAADAVTSAERGLTAAVENARNAQIKSAEAIKGAQQDLRAATHQAAEDQITDAERVSDAQRSLADVVQQAAQAQQTAARNVVEAEQSVAAAQKDALQAQQGLNAAREQAVQDAEDLANQVTDGQLDQRAATLQLQQAQQDLQTTIADPRATDLQRQQAQLTFDQAQQRLSEQIAQNQRLVTEKAKSDAAGVAGSKVVQDAQDALLASQKRLVDAQQAETDAVNAQTLQQQKSAEAITQAQRAVADAVRESSDKQRQDLEAVAASQQKVADASREAAVQQRQSSATIASAQQAVVTAQRGVEQANNRVGTSGGAALDTVQQKLAKLTPEGRRFVAFIQGELLPAFHGLSSTAQANLLPGLQAGITNLLPLIPAFTKFVGDLAAEMGTLFAQAGKALQAPFWTRFFAFLSKDVLQIIGQMIPTLGNFAQGFAGLYEAFAPVINQFGVGLLGLSQRFADFGANAGKNKGFQDFLAYIQAEGPKVAHTIGDIFQAFGHIAVALAPLGGVVLGVVDGFAKLITALPSPVILAVASAILTLVVASKALAVATAAVDLVMDANPFVLALVAAVELGVGLVQLYKHSETFRDIVNEVWAEVRTAISTAYTDVIEPTFQAIAAFVTNDLAPAFQFLYVNVIEPVWAGIGTVIGGAWKVIRAIFEAISVVVRDVLGPVFDKFLLPVIRLAWQEIQIVIQVAWVAIQIVFKLLEIAVKILGGVFTDLWRYAVKPAIDGIGSVISLAWNTVIKPVLTALGGFIVDTVAPAFRKGVDAVAAAWGGIINVAKKPVRFIVETVINDAIIGTFNKVAEFFGIKPIAKIALPKGFAGGGVLPGYAPGVDSVPAMLSPGEGVLVPEVVRALGPSTIHAMNAGAVARRRGFSVGGIVGGVRGGLSDVGSFIGNTLSDVTELIKDPGSLIKSAISKVLDTVRTAFGDNDFVSLVSGLPRTLEGDLITKLQSVIGSVTHSGGNTSGPPASVTGNQAIVQAVAATKYGWIGEEWADLYRVVMRESGFNNTAQNPTSTAYGMFQFLDGTWAGVGGSKTSNPTLQTQYGLKYIADSYGDPVGAWNHELSAGWYDEGGYLPPGLTTVFNGTSKPEAVFTSTQWDLLKSRAGSDGGMPPVQVTVNNPVPETVSQSTTQIMRRIAYLRH